MTMLTFCIFGTPPQGEYLLTFFMWNNYKFKGFFMIRVYWLVGAAVVIVLGAYWCGWRVATERCQRMQSNATAQQQNQIFKMQEEVNAEVLGRGVDDIRRVLRAQYTIAE